ncbi:MAG: DUF4249 domain-containing protein [Siphonobacter sp.]
MVKYYFYLLLVLSLVSCIEPYDATVRHDITVLIVDGTINDQDSVQTISLKRSIPNSSFVTTQLVTGATMTVLVNGATTIAFTETSSGQYTAPTGFKGQVGNTYQLKIQTSDGQEYESTVEEMPTVPPISGIHQDFSPDAIQKDDFTKLPAHNLYVEFKDPVETRNFYQWKYTHWEKQPICATCINGLYQTSVSECVPLSPPPSTTFQYDYACQGNCWDIYYSTAVMIYTDLYSNGHTVTDQLVAQIPYYQRENTLVEIQQISLSTGAYRYYQLIDQQTQRTGTLADTPPAALVGNVKNLTNPNEYVAGYFSVSSITKIRYTVDRSDAILGGYAPIGYPSHTIVLEPSTDPGRPPLATCKLSSSRTPNTPEGWQ